MNDSGTSGSICAETVPLHALDLSFEDTRRQLYRHGNAMGWYTPRGHRCSNLIEMTKNLRGATDPVQRDHLIKSIARTSAELATLPLPPKGMTCRACGVHYLDADPVAMGGRDGFECLACVEQWLIDDGMTIEEIRAGAELDALASTDVPTQPKKNIATLSLERLREVLDYDPLTGALTWRFRLSPKCRLGEPAGVVKSQGYRKITIDGRNYPASHLAWFHYYGVAPEGLVDHKDRDKANDRIENLRPATSTQNSRNIGRNSANTTGFKGVAVFNKPGQPTRYRALIRANGMRIFLGIFDTPEEAHDVYCKAAAKYHGEFARTE
jgi:hypothetical protein